MLVYQRVTNMVDFDGDSIVMLTCRWGFNQHNMVILTNENRMLTNI